MINIGLVTGIVSWFKNLYNKTTNLSCTHELVFLDQTWERQGSQKRWILKNRFGCKKCQSLQTKDIGA